MSSIDYLRDATIQALANGAWDDADDLFTVLKSKVAQQQPVTPAAEPTSNDIPPIDQPKRYRSESEWAVIIRNHFIPVMRKENRLELSIYDIYDWILHRSGLELSSRDLEKMRSSNQERWKDRVGDAIRRLKFQGEFTDGPTKRTFRIVGTTEPQQLPLGTVVS